MNQTEYEYLAGCLRGAERGGRLAWVWLDYVRVWCKLHPSEEKRAVWLAAESSGPEAGLALLRLVAHNKGLHQVKEPSTRHFVAKMCPQIWQK